MTNKNIVDHVGDKIRIVLREEQLDISKKKIETGKVKMHKEVVIDEKNITVPVKREELVIERTILKSKEHSQDENATEIIRIPLSEERIEVTKHQVKLGEVTAYKHKFQEIEHLEETLKKEEILVKTNGNAKVKDIKTQ